jgi:hypothetical protein
MQRPARPPRVAARGVCTAALALAVAGAPAAAQQRPRVGAAGTPAADTGRRAIAPDTARRASGPRPRAAGAAPRRDLRPPVSPRRALLSSLLLPGLGQARLERPTAGAVFAGVELVAFAMIGKSLADLRAARALRSDSVTRVITVDTLGVPTTTVTRVEGPFTSELVRARGLHAEDWIAVILFNHLLSGAEAFVSAQLYDLPAQISARPTSRGGAAVAVSIAW